MRSRLEAKTSENPASIGRHRKAQNDRRRQLHCRRSVDQFFIQNINSLPSTDFSASTRRYKAKTVVGSRYKLSLVPSSVKVLQKIDLIIMLQCTAPKSPPLQDRALL